MPTDITSVLLYAESWTEGLCAMSQTHKKQHMIILSNTFNAFSSCHFGIRKSYPEFRQWCVHWG